MRGGGGSWLWEVIRKNEGFKWRTQWYDKYVCSVGLLTRTAYVR